MSTPLDRALAAFDRRAAQYEREQNRPPEPDDMPLRVLMARVGRADLPDGLVWMPLALNLPPDLGLPFVSTDLPFLDPLDPFGG